MGVAARLTSALVASLLTALLILGGTLMLSLRHHLLSQAAHEAQSVAQQTARLASSTGVNGQTLSLNDPGMLGAAVGRSSLYLQVSQNHHIIQRSPNLGAALLPLTPPPTHPLTSDGWPLWGTIPTVRHVPVVLARAAVRQQGQVIGHVEAAVSLQPALNTLRTVGRGLLKVGIAVLVLTSGLSALFVYRAFRRVRRLSRAARQVESAQDLSRRIPLQGPRDEVRELAQSFNHMLQRLEHSFEGQRLVTAQASHQLRTPVAAAIGYATMLKNWGHTDPQLVSEGIEVVYEQLLRLQRTLDVILRLAELDVQRPHTHECLSLITFLKTWREQSPWPVKLMEGQPVSVRLDGAMLDEVLNILVDNVQRHGGSDTTVTICWQVRARTVELMVQDDGPGFPPDVLPHLFQPFAKDSRSAGIGLGLALARTLVEQQGGTITADNVVPHGARVCLTFPIPHA